MNVSTLNLLTIAEVAEALGVSSERVGQFCREGRLGQKVGGQWVIPKDELEQFRTIPRKRGRPRNRNS